MVYDTLGELPNNYKKSIIEAIDIITGCGQEYNIEINDLILFGSCARLDIHVGSDIDIAIVSREPIVNRVFRGHIVGDAEFLSTKIPCDIAFMTEDIMRSKDKNRLRDNIRREGIYLMKGGLPTDEYKQLL